MGTVPAALVTELREQAHLRRAVETGTFRGDGTAILSELFPEVVTIELSRELHKLALARFAHRGNIRLIRGESGAELPTVVDCTVPTFYFLDAHWSGGETAGEEHECPLLAELGALGAGHWDDCIVIDDARLFRDPPPPPHKPTHWPTFAEVAGVIRAAHPDHYVSVAGDQIIAVPSMARPSVDAWAAVVGGPGAESLRASIRHFARRLMRRRLSGR